MAQWDFVVSWEDVWLALDLILKRPGTELVHDLWYKNDNIVLYSSLNSEVRSAIAARPSLYIKGLDFCKLPLELRGAGESEKLYLVESNRGGPLLQLLITGEYSVGGNYVIPPSMLTYADEYYNSISGEWEKPSRELKAAYKEIQGLMKKNMVRHIGPRGFVWIGNSAFQLLKTRRMKTTFFGLKF